MNSVTERLSAFRGGQTQVPLSARAIVGLAANPGCARRALVDAAGIDKGKLARQAGYARPSVQSPFAIGRGQNFEKRMKEQGGAALLTLLREELGLSLPEVSYIPLDSVGNVTSSEVRYRQTRRRLVGAARGEPSPGTLYDHPLLRLAVGGQHAYLEPDLIAFKLGDRFYVVEIKSFPVIDKKAGGTQVAAAIQQASVYVIALQNLFAEHGVDPELVSSDVFLVTPKDFGNDAVATRTDARKQIAMLQRQLAGLDRIDGLLAVLPPGLTLDPRLDAEGTPTREAGDLAATLRGIPSRYRPTCMDYCELAGLCRDQERHEDSLDLFGPGVTDVLGGVTTMGTALDLARGTRQPAEDQEDLARSLRRAERLRLELAGGAA